MPKLEKVRIGYYKQVINPAMIDEFLNTFLDKKIIPENGIIDLLEIPESLSTLSLDELIENENLNVLVLPLSHIPDIRNTSLSIAALSPRNHPGVKIYKHINSDLSLKNWKTDVDRCFCTSPALKAQLKQLFPDFKYESINQTFIHSLENNQILATEELVADNDLTYELLIRLHVKEVVPMPGSGTMAFICKKKDLDSRRLFKTMHQSEVSQCTNVERSLLFALSEFDWARAHCYQDELKNFHLNTCISKNGNIYRTQLSQSTSSKLVQRTKEQLKKIYEVSHI